MATILAGPQPGEIFRTEEQPAWWDRRWLLLACAMLSGVPLLWPALPPLTDLPGHMGRWHITMAIGQSEFLARYYEVHWRLIGNLGMDLLVPVLARFAGLMVATKLAVILIPLLTATGLLWAAREVHGRVPPTAYAALPFAYAWPFQFGFVNFALSQALALCALVWWLRWGREERLALRAAIFAPVACILWLAHSSGWGLFGLMAAGSELGRLRTAGCNWPRALRNMMFQCVPLAVPAIYMVVTTAHQHGHGGADDWFQWQQKLLWILADLRDRWEAYDLLSMTVPLILIYAGVRGSSKPFDARLGWPAFFCLVAFLILPRLLLGGAYVDMRVVPLMLMLSLIAIRPPASGPKAALLATIAMSFFLVRTTGTTVSFVLRAAEQQQELGAIAMLPRGAAVLSLVSRPCNEDWQDRRRDHLPGLAIVFADAFTNVQWDLEGQQNLRVRYRIASPYLADPSQHVFPDECPDIGSHFDNSIAHFPRRAFTHVWTIGFPPSAAKASDLDLIWSNGSSSLYRVRRIS